jgi:hypothetical protein
MLVLGAVAMCVFCAAAIVFLRLLPPHSNVDYLVAGVVATLLALVTVFVTINLSRFKTGEVFFTVRRRQSREETAAPPAGAEP